ncbi:MAG: hypothetical protein E6230_02610 [Paenibacillus dendritiformis]|uniref:hypothetical protein n=1 Tax=uncultured Paenibacillus sp. TaxID=227322 RepID=UPI0025CCDCCC|nr:hypothetical protein [uncultured Paenibacillus sp.]MDU5141065.1 hypothetical protein [Paenibacillus dendritiformis]
MKEQQPAANEPEAKYSKEQFLRSRKFLGGRDILDALMDSEKLYTEKQAKQILDGYNKRTVK